MADIIDDSLNEIRRELKVYRTKIIMELFQDKWMGGRDYLRNLGSNWEYF
jgi:hypothetical protein